MSGAGVVGRATAHAAVWALLSTAGARVFTLVSLTILARLLAPREFGLLAFAMTYIAYAETIGDLGSGVALVYWHDRRDDAAQVTFLINLVAGTFWFVLTLFIAPYVAAFFQTPEGTPIVRVLAIGFLIKFLGTTHDALAQKDLRFRARAVPEFGFAVSKAVVALVLAYFGYGAWSLVWGHLAGLTAATIFAWVVVPWRPSLRVPGDLLKPMLAYGRNITFVNVLHAIVSDADLAFVGHFLGLTVLGFYQMACRVTEAGVSVVLRVISKVLFPAFAELHGSGEKLRRPFLFATHFVPAITLPSSIGLSVLSTQIVICIFGPQWVESGRILAILAVYVAVATLGNHAGDVLKATGRAHVLAQMGAVQAVLTLAALFVAARISAEAVAGALLIVNLLMTIVQFVISARLIEVPLREVLAAFGPSVISTTAMAAAVRLWLRAVPLWRPWPQLLSGIAVGAAVYLAVLRLTDPEIFRWVGQALRRRAVVPAPAPAE